MTYLRLYQLYFMLFLAGSCGVLAFMTLFSDALSRRRKPILFLMEFSAMWMLLFDRWAYLYRGNVSELGYYMVRYSNCMSFFFSLFLPFLVAQYLKDLFLNEVKFQKAPLSLKLCDWLFGIGFALLMVAQFTDLYYVIDAHNNYFRTATFPLSYVVPVLTVVLEEICVLQYRARLSRGFLCSLMFCIVLPTVMSLLQIFLYGVSLITMSTALMAIIFYIYALTDVNKTALRAKTAEIEFYKKAEKQEAAMFEQTAEALANAIDAKDRYTHGHSARVALISRQIATEAGFSDKECTQIYYAALLHDVGKIGIRDEIINKVGRLTDEEFEEIKRHPILGYQILSSIKQSPSLSVGAHYHHERYDGSGYPEGLSGEVIPEVARIIAVADAYDAMTSSRSYRDALPRQAMVDELTRGMGKQFDPKYDRIMLHILGVDESSEADESNKS